MSTPKVYTVAGVRVRNRFATKDGKAKCAHRTAPYCATRATVAVGLWGYCGRHADLARRDLDAWHRAHPETQAPVQREPSAVARSGKSILEYLLEDEEAAPC